MNKSKIIMLGLILIFSVSFFANCSKDLIAGKCLEKGMMGSCEKDDNTMLLLGLAAVASSSSSGVCVSNTYVSSTNSYVFGFATTYTCSDSGINAYTQQDSYNRTIASYDKIIAEMNTVSSCSTVASQWTTYKNSLTVSSFSTDATLESSKNTRLGTTTSAVRYQSKDTTITEYASVLTASTSSATTVAGYSSSQVSAGRHMTASEIDKYNAYYYTGLNPTTASTTTISGQTITTFSAASDLTCQNAYKAANLSTFQTMMGYESTFGSSKSANTSPILYYGTCTAYKSTDTTSTASKCATITRPSDFQ